MNLWKKAEELFIAADLHKPEEHRFQGWTLAQTAAYELWLRQPNLRQLLFYPTGTGKTKTSLALRSATRAVRLWSCSGCR